MPVFLLDENVNRSAYIVERCAEMGIQVLRVHDLDLLNTDDEVIFEVAAVNEYILVTANIKHFRQAALALMAQGEYPGAVWLPSKRYRNIEAIISRIIDVAMRYDEFEVREWWVHE